jgi:hypothetical protein
MGCQNKCFQKYVEDCNLGYECYDGSWSWGMRNFFFYLLKQGLTMYIDWLWTHDPLLATQGRD